MTPELDELRALINDALDLHLPNASAIAQPLVDAMRYTTLGGGKRIRPMLVCATCTGLGGALEDALAPACAVEFIHAYSLIHDDLPSMDDDELRHGLPASHIKFGEATAVLAGTNIALDALLIFGAPGVPALGIRGATAPATACCGSRCRCRWRRWWRRCAGSGSS